MFGTPFRSLRRPVLLIVVFGFFLMIVGLTALSQAIIVSSQSSQTMLDAVVGSDAATVRGFANAYLMPADLGPGGLSATRAAALQAQVRTIVSAGQILRIEVRLPDGTVLLSDTGDASATHGRRRRTSSPPRAGTVTAGFHPVAEAESVGATLPASDILRAYFPVKVNGEVVAVVGIWRDAAPILGDLDSLRRQVILVTLFAGAVAAVALYLVFRAAQRRILRQTDQLLEATQPGPDDRHAQSRRARRRARRRDRGGAPGRRDARDRPPRHRQLPEPQRDPRPSGRRSGAHRGRRRSCATCSRPRSLGPLRTRRVPRDRRPPN